MVVSLRRRRATVAVAALVAGTPPLLPGVAVAAPAPPPGAGAREPDRTSFGVLPESAVRVVNGTGRRARLLLDGVARGELPAGSSADVLFHHGPVLLALRPICVFPAESVVKVEVGLAPHGPDAASPGSVEVPPDAVPGSYPPPSDRLGGGSADLVAPLAPVRPAGPVTTLLALVATICVVGVSAGAIRAIYAQRATRTVIA